MIKIFRINDYEWWAGNSLEEIRSAYEKITGEKPEENFEEPYELSEEQLDKYKYVDEDEPEKTRTFREELQKNILEG